MDINVVNELVSYLRGGYSLSESQAHDCAFEFLDELSRYQNRTFNSVQEIDQSVFDYELMEFANDFCDRLDVDTDLSWAQREEW